MVKQTKIDNLVISVHTTFIQNYRKPYVLEELYSEYKNDNNIKEHDYFQTTKTKHDLWISSSIKKINELDNSINHPRWIMIDSSDGILLTNGTHIDIKEVEQTKIKIIDNKTYFNLNLYITNNEYSVHPYYITQILRPTVLKCLNIIESQKDKILDISTIDNTLKKQIFNTIKNNGYIYWFNSVTVMNKENEMIYDNQYIKNLEYSNLNKNNKLQLSSFISHIIKFVNNDKKYKPRLDLSLLETYPFIPLDYHNIKELIYIFIIFGIFLILYVLINN